MTKNIPITCTQNTYEAGISCYKVELKAGHLYNTCSQNCNISLKCAVRILMMMVRIVGGLKLKMQACVMKRPGQSNIKQQSK